MEFEREKIRGVNLGGWLVLERWITPSLFERTDATDEYTFMQTPGARDKLERHRKTYITEDDFTWIAGSGLNAVRIPVGYWLLGDAAPYVPGIEVLDWAVKTAESHGLKVLIDLHGAEGSQNGYDHSGRAGAALWYQERSFKDNTLMVLESLVERYGQSPSLWGIELLNEPKAGALGYISLKKFYRRAYEQLTNKARPGLRIVFSDGFVPRLFSGTLKPRSGFPPVMDVHWYQFGLTNVDKYFKKVEERVKEIKRLQRSQPVIIGEWSGMLSHHTLAGLAEEEKAALERRHIELQLQVYKEAAGWFYWTYKTEGSGVWNLRWLIEHQKFQLD